MRQSKLTLLATLTLASALFIQGCGWQLRGMETLPESLQTLHLKTPSGQSDFTRLLTRSLKVMDVTLTDSARAAPYTLSVSPVKETRRTLSTTGGGKVAEYELTSSLSYKIVSAKGETVSEPTTLSTEKIYLYDRNNVVGAFEEENLLRKEMQRDLVQQLVRRYRAIASPTPDPQEAATL